ncbi:MAG: Xaa-Pro peptidase family protein [Syntrophobacteraceae bacterium]|jgi:Xaa-Pro aminopeptidase|nr:Xaa-Pro peptidase family protein [Syntrophobacteraceae bacterium]
MLSNVPMEEVAARIVALQRLLQRSEVDVAVIRQNADLFYFTGTVQDAHLIVPAVGRPVFLVKRDVRRAESQSPVRPVVPLSTVKDVPRWVFEACGTESVERIGMELDVLPASTFFFYDEKLFARQQIVDVSGLVRQVRMIKSPWEIGMMRGAARISQSVADAAPRWLTEGVSELELSIELERVARLAGHLGLIRLRAFNMDMYFGHVLSGPEAAIPSYADAPTGGEGLSAAFGQGPGMRRIQAGEIVSVDTMMNHNGYLNDQTRNFCIGRPPGRLMAAYDDVREMHRRFRERARPGAVTGELYEEVCRWAREAGWEAHFMGHGDSRVSFVAHGLGIEVDEFPFVAQGQKLTLREGMTFAFEPKLILPGEGIVGLENTYLVTSAGLESLNTATEELLIL